jgi:hypothetical protein
MDLRALREPLPIDMIDFRVGNINKGGYCSLLAYKDARADMIRLDEVVGPLNWKREHSRDNHNCTVSIFDEERGHWVSKEDTGTESNAEAQKGLASDSFKRACTNWGIGRELYAYGDIQIKLNADEFTVDNGRAKPTFKFRLKEWKWFSQFKDGELVYLVGIDQDGKERFRKGERQASYTQEQHDQYLEIMASGDGFSMKKFANDVGKDVISDLFNSAPDGQKVIHKNKYRDLVNEANKQLKLTLGALELAASEGSADQVNEIMGELTPVEIEIVEAGMDQVLAAQVNQLWERIA